MTSRVEGRYAALLTIAALFGVQLGTSTIVSGAIFGCALLLLLLKLDLRQIDLLTFVELGLVSILAGLYMGLNVLVLREARLLVVGCLLILFLRGRLKRNIDVKLFFWIALSIVVFGVFFQSLANSAGSPMVLPDSIFAISDDKALASEEIEKAKWGGYELRVRHAVTFSEPSYLGLILIGLTLLTLIQYGKSLKGYAFVLLLFSTALVSGTAYGQAGILAMTLLWRAKFKARTVLAALTVACVLFSLLFYYASDPQNSDTRLYKFLTLQDGSAYIRLFQPFQIIFFNAAHLPLGVPVTASLDYYAWKGFFSLEDDAPLQNSLLNLFITRGYLAFPVLWILFRALRTREEAIFLMLAMCQNGSIFSFDKLFVVSLMIWLSRQAAFDAVRRLSRAAQLKASVH